MSEAVKQHPKSINTCTIRISNKCYANLSTLKAAFAAKQGARCSFSDLLNECVKVAEALLAGHECYLVGDKVYETIEEARGEAILLSVKQNKPAQAPTVLLRLGKDQELRF